MTEVTYEDSKTYPDIIELAIAEVVHNTENHRSHDAVYEDLPGCCLYKRPHTKLE